MIAKSLIYKGAMPKIEIDPETYSVTADGELLVCEPAETLPISQRYFFSTREASHSRAMSRSRTLPASPMVTTMTRRKSLIVPIRSAAAIAFGFDIYYVKHHQ